MSSSSHKGEHAEHTHTLGAIEDLNQRWNDKEQKKNKKTLVDAQINADYGAVSCSEKHLENVARVKFSCV